MKNYFIINPAAGGGKFAEKLSNEIESVCKERNADFEIYVTKSEGDATEYVRRVCEQTPADQTVRLYSCGGDGTNYEVISGAVGFDNALVGFIPSGTGNDFIRCFDGGENFSDLGAQLDGRTEKIDLIRCNDRYVMNMMNTGFDCEVAHKASKLKTYPLISSSMAYIMGVVAKLITKPTTGFKIALDGGEYLDRPSLLLATFSNGRYCGGGFKSSPKARLRSGYIDVCLISDLSRLKFIGIVGKYRSGEYLFDESLKNIVEYRRATSVEIDFGKNRNICIDGEIFETQTLKLEVMPKALNIIVPLGADFAENEDEGSETKKEEAVLV